MQRPIRPNGTSESAAANKITEQNWTSNMGEKKCVFSKAWSIPTSHLRRARSAHMFPDYLAFFSSEIAKHGVGGALERYVFSPEANANGTLMLARFVGGALHPMIEAGVGLHSWYFTARV